MAFADPVKNITKLSLHPGMVVADMGCGSGMYSLLSAGRVGGSGMVYAIDIQQDILTALSNTAKREELTNIETIHGDVDEHGGTYVKDGICDALIISNILFQSEKKEGLAKEAFRIAKEGGKTLVIDWSDSFGNLGPTSDMVYSEAEARVLFEKAGFSFQDRFSAGDHHYGLLFMKGKT